MAFLSTNSKTGASYDFGICPLMKKDKNDKYYSTCGVKKCYSVSMLNGQRRKSMRGKFEVSIHEDVKDLKKEIAISNATAPYDEGILRGFSFADYLPEREEEFLYIVRNSTRRHVVISKTLWLLGSRELLEEVSEKTTLSLGFTKQLYPKFKKFYEANKDLKFSVALTINNTQELKELMELDPELMAEVDVLHTTEVHFKIPRLGNKGYTSALQKHLDEIESIAPNLRLKLCNMYGETQMIKKGCMDCNGCDQICRERK